ncbi:hypothetical protein [Nocardioides sp. zg-1228]|uniref:hypothetical protein n=1 Tax=Nocardioides sp. zg-1228 TaxID=2763008 RepID=UPI0016423BD7|nr:hypothetical protein [Nocardioides sp. zg-1228]MBC2934514.1 hypothetical protein [Nocardioides sp. zg-1228]QSF59272.1 hypothetical protein JX575_09005 [Nocardioides sp. zg-1228]
MNDRAADPADVWRGRVQDHLDAAGRPPLGGMADWEVFPFERDGLTPKAMGERVVPEPDRSRDAADCRTCRSLTVPAQVLHTGDRLAVIRPGGTSLPFVANIVARQHVLIDDLDDDGHAELGRLIGRTYAAVSALDGVGNVHLTKWENGSGHLSVNVMARPLGVLELRGSNLPVWADMLPDIPQAEYDERAEAVRAALS